MQMSRFDKWACSLNGRAAHHGFEIIEASAVQCIAKQKYQLFGHTTSTITM